MNVDGSRMAAEATGRFRAYVKSLRATKLDRAFFRPSSWPNVALAAFMLGCNLIAGLLNAGSATAVTATAFGLEQIACLLLAWRPRLVEWLLVAALGSWGIAAVTGVDTGSWAVTAIAIYTIGTKRSWRRTVVLLTITLVLVDATGLIEYAAGQRVEGQGLFELVLGLALGSAAYGGLAALGLYMNTRRAYVLTLVERTEDLERERELLERERDLMAQQAVAVERARIARELHDVVAHHVSVMVIQAGAAQASLPPDAVAAGQAIEAIRETGREAMSEMRRLLGLLRSEASIGLGPDNAGGRAGAGSGTSISESARSPQPGVKDLEALADRTREAGVEVALEIVGAPRRIPAAIDLSVYRVAQEALTNTLRHAGPGATAQLRLTFGPKIVAIEVTDDGHGKPAVDAVERKHGVGHGLVGMRERVSLFGGWLETGPIPAGGYRVMARFPLEDEVSAS